MTDAEAVRGVGDGEVPQGGHPSPDGVTDEDGEPDEEPDADAGGGLVAVVVADQREGRPDEEKDEPPGDHLEQDGAHQQTVRHRDHRAFRRLGCSLVTSSGPAEEVGP